MSMSFDASAVVRSLKLSTLRSQLMLAHAKRVSRSPMTRAVARILGSGFTVRAYIDCRLRSCSAVMPLGTRGLSCRGEELRDVVDAELHAQRAEVRLGR